ncbi:conserved hypothetical protein [Tenacibaculum sediminilitoris]|uniref:hypothetical protein n=1 Tax=Tenacibaculum sediminilitoris TaxID=1820334 RepID=UPI003892F996
MTNYKGHKKESSFNTTTQYNQNNKSICQLKDNRSKPEIVQRMFNGYSMEPDTGADNAGAFYLQEQREAQRRRIADEAAEAQRRQEEQEAEAVKQEQRRSEAEAVFKQMKYQLSGNARGAWLAVEEALNQGGDEKAKGLVYRVVNEYMRTVSGSVNADREQYGGDRGFSRR